MSITMPLHSKKHQEMYNFSRLLYVIANYPVNNEIHHTAATLSIQRNALLDTLRRIMELTESDTKKYLEILFHLDALFPKKDYSPYNTESNLEKSLALNKALFNLGHSIAHNFLINAANKPHRLLKYFEYSSIPAKNLELYQKQWQLAESEYSRYQRYEIYFKPQVLDAAKRFTDMRVKNFHEFSARKKIMP